MGRPGGGPLCPPGAPCFRGAPCALRALRRLQGSCYSAWQGQGQQGGRLAGSRFSPPPPPPPPICCRRFRSGSSGGHRSLAQLRSCASWSQHSPPPNSAVETQDVAEYWEQVLKTVDKATASKLIAHLDVTQVPTAGCCLHKFDIMLAQGR